MDNQAWSLESFVDSLVVELDKTRETLAVKSINRPLTYTVKDMSLDLQIFPTFDGDDVRFRTAQSGEQGASRITLQLASITDQQVRVTSKPPPKRGDLPLDETELAPQVKKNLRRLGVTSVSDLEQIERNQVGLPEQKAGMVDYRNLANVIEKAKRARTPPQIRSVSLSESDGARLLEIEGEHLATSRHHTPVAVLNDRLGDVVVHSSRSLRVRLGPDVELRPTNDLILTLDPYCIIRMHVKHRETRDSS